VEMAAAYGKAIDTGTEMPDYMMRLWQELMQFDRG
jgi:hypothetical protein